MCNRFHGVWIIGIFLVLVVLRSLWLDLNRSSDVEAKSVSAMKDKSHNVPSLRYYLYNSTAMTQEDELKTIDKQLEKLYGRENEFEKAIHAVLQRHEMRTMDPERADVFLVPTPIGQFLLYQEASYNKAFKELLSSPTFQYGHRHGIVAIVDHFKNKPFAEWFPHLTNVTIVRSYDPNRCRQLAEQGECRDHDFHPLFMSQPHHSTNTMSIGLPPEPDVPFLPASVVKFQQSPVVFFYRTRREGSRYNSTIYRHAPLQVVPDLVLPPLTNTSIGLDLDHESWLRDLTSARFCLVIRGDTPHSHAFLTAVRVGCIPVVVSDHYPSYAPPMWLDMREFCIFIPEDEFVLNPADALNRIVVSYSSTTGDENGTASRLLKEKLEALAFAQRTLLVDHPESMFVQTLVKGISDAVDTTSRGL